MSNSGAQKLPKYFTIYVRNKTHIIKSFYHLVAVELSYKTYFRLRCIELSYFVDLWPYKRRRVTQTPNIENIISCRLRNSRSWHAPYSTEIFMWYKLFKIKLSKLHQSYQVCHLGRLMSLVSVIYCPIWLSFFPRRIPLGRISPEFFVVLCNDLVHISKHQ